MHVICLRTGKVMHQFSQRRIIFMLCIDVYDMGPIAKRFSGFLNHAVNVVDGQPCLQDIPLCNENNIGFPKRLIAVTGVGQICVQQATVVSGTACVCAFIPPLDLNVVVLALLINRQNIQADGASLKIFNAVLTVDLLNNEIFAFQNDMQQ